MGEKKVTRMVLKVDLQCEKCYRKVKKVLCKFPQIQDQVFDEKQNTVRIKVVCCSPEKMKQKIRCKGGESIKSIEIVPPTPPPPTPKKEPEKPEAKPPQKQEPIQAEPAPPITTTTQQPPGQAKAEPPKQEKLMVTFVDSQPKPAPGFPPPGYPNPVGMCCRECYEGRRGGPSYQLGYYGPPRCNCGYYGRPEYDSWGGGDDCYRVNRRDYFCEENPNAACRIM